MTDSLTPQDIELIFEAFDTHKNKASNSMLIGSMMNIMLSSTKEKAQAAAKMESDKFDREKGVRQLLDDRITLVKAKLIRQKDQALAQRAFDQ